MGGSGPYLLQVVMHVMVQTFMVRVRRNKRGKQGYSMQCIFVARNDPTRTVRCPLCLWETTFPATSSYLLPYIDIGRIESPPAIKLDYCAIRLCIANCTLRTQTLPHFLHTSKLSQHRPRDQLIHTTSRPLSRIYQDRLISAIKQKLP